MPSRVAHVPQTCLPCLTYQFSLAHSARLRAQPVPFTPRCFCSPSTYLTKEYADIAHGKDFLVILNELGWILAFFVLCWFNESISDVAQTYLIIQIKYLIKLRSYIWFITFNWVHISNWINIPVTDSLALLERLKRLTT